MFSKQQKSDISVNVADLADDVPQWTFDSIWLGMTACHQKNNSQGSMAFP